MLPSRKLLLSSSTLHLHLRISQGPTQNWINFIWKWAKIGTTIAPLCFSTICFHNGEFVLFFSTSVIWLAPRLKRFFPVSPAYVLVKPCSPQILQSICKSNISKPNVLIDLKGARSTSDPQKIQNPKYTFYSADCHCPPSPPIVLRKNAAKTSFSEAEDICSLNRSWC